MGVWGLSETLKQFCHENNEKRVRALKKQQEDTQLVQQRQSLIEDLQVEIGEMKHISESMDANVRSHRVYQVGELVNLQRS